MTTTTHPVAAAEAAAKVLELIRNRLPSDARWILEEADDGFYHMTIYANLDDKIAITALAGPVLGDMLQKGIPFAILFNTPSMLKHLDTSIDVRDVNWSLER